MRLIESEETIELHFVAGQVEFYTEYGREKGRLHNPTQRDVNAVNRAVKSDSDLTDGKGLAKYIHSPLSKSVEELAPVGLVEYDYNWYMEWIAKVDKNAWESDKENIKKLLIDEITGQSSDGWGEGFEQRPLSNGILCSPYGNQYRFKVILEDD